MTMRTADCVEQFLVTSEFQLDLTLLRRLHQAEIYFVRLHRYPGLSQLGRHNSFLSQSLERFDTTSDDVYIYTSNVDVLQLPTTWPSLPPGGQCRLHTDQTTHRSTSEYSPLSCMYSSRRARGPSTQTPVSLQLFSPNNHAVTITTSSTSRKQSPFPHIRRHCRLLTLMPPHREPRL